MRISNYFNLNRNQSTLDFLDIDVDGDLPVFVDPLALRNLGSQWGHECVALLENYFQSVLISIKAGEHARARSLLSCLNERNEFHLGFSKGRSRGHALGPVAAKRIWESLTTSRAVQTGLLQDLEDTVLFVDGVGPDMLSDAICNIIRGPLIRYTQEACSYYGIPLVDGVRSGPLWEPVKERWEVGYTSLPEVNNGLIILVPKLIARVRESYSPSSYYRNYLLPMMQEHEKSINSTLVYVVKSGPNKGAKKVNKKDLSEKYGASKMDSARLTGQFPAALGKFKRDKRSNPAPPLGNTAFAEIENVAPPDYSALLDAVTRILPGKNEAAAYEDAVEKLLSATLYPALSFPQKQHEIHGGRKRIDITYVNAAQGGFFNWLARNYPAAHVFIECKNYGREIGNPEVDQLAGRFSPSRGSFGLLVVRSIDDRERLEARCRDTATDGRGFIVVLDDEDLRVLITERVSVLQGFNDNILYRRFRALIS